MRTLEPALLAAIVLLAACHASPGGSGAASCRPSCDGKSCGPDGCGGACGTCLPYQLCQDGQCGCTPRCTARNCGDDSCGGTCGTCADGQVCSSLGTCSCAPSCDGRSCGDDGCGGVCGTCPAGQSCENGGCGCTPQCQGRECGDDGCGGVCGSCSGERRCSSGTCRLPLGSACTADGDCTTGTCLNRTCTATCSFSVDCPEGGYCGWYEVDADGDGRADSYQRLCAPEVASGLPEGSTCEPGKSVCQRGACAPRGDASCQPLSACLAWCTAGDALCEEDCRAVESQACVVCEALLADCATRAACAASDQDCLRRACPDIYTRCRETITYGCGTTCFRDAGCTDLKCLDHPVHGTSGDQDLQYCDATPRTCQPFGRGFEICDGSDDDCDGNADDQEVCADSYVSRTDLAAVTIPAGACASVTFTIPPGTISFALNVQGDGSGDLHVCSVEGPQGPLSGLARLYDPGPAFGVVVPIRPSDQVIDGAWTVEIGAAASSGASFTPALVTRSGPLLPVGGLKINFFLDQPKGLTAASIRTDPTFARLLDTARLVLGKAGILVRPDYDVYELTQEEMQRFDAVNLADDDASFGAYLSISARARDSAGVNVFLTRSLGSGVLAESGALPGCVRELGTPCTGLALSMDSGFDDWSTYPEGMGISLAHELGHMLGLHHTTEASGVAFDPLGDTPQCPISNDRSGDGVVSALECQYLDGDNLMFWADGGRLHTALSADQRFVIGRTAWLHTGLRNQTNAGAPCTTAADCQSGGLLPLCMPESQKGKPTGFQGGYCLPDCPGGETCGPGARCVSIAVGKTPAADRCVATCGSPADCRAGYTCLPEGLCWPKG